ncbi:MAG: SPOR domain-containing protein [Phycisphaerales bacterium JB043]
MRQIALVLTCVLVIAGCRNNKTDAAATFAEGRYELAYVQAKHQANNARAKRRDSGRLLAGLSAEALGLDDEATGWLEPLLHHKDANIAGRARVAMAKIEQRRGNGERAQSLVRSAMSMLDGESAQQARTIADSMNISTGAVHATSERDGIYTVQLGAFSTYRNASSRAEQARSEADRYHYGDPRVIAITDARGRNLYLVHVGRFALKTDAQQALRHLGNEGLIALYRE